MLSEVEMNEDNSHESDCSSSVKECTRISTNHCKVNKVMHELISVRDTVKQTKPSKKTKKYYKELRKFYQYIEDNRIIKFASPEQDDVSPTPTNSENHVTIKMKQISPTQLIEKNNRRAFFASKIVLGLNLTLFVGKILACYYSGSISMVSSTLDSGVDILSSAITFFTNYRVKKCDFYKHPQGKTRMVPLSIIIISVIMAITSLQVITESCRRMITSEALLPEFSYFLIGVVGVTVASKIIVFFYCSAIKSSTTKLLAQDSRNDILTNITVLVGLLLSHYLWIYGDSMSALVISTYVFITWVATGVSHLGLIVGKTASPKQLQLYGIICLLHDPDNIQYISTVRAYAFGHRYLLEVDIVLSETMPLSKAHNIGETLQQRLETLPDIERAFVHLDFEKDHNPQLEHKLGILF